MPLKRLRSFVERRSPLGAGLYRSLRDQLVAARLTPRRTVEGFLLAADEAMLNGTFEPDERRIAQRLLPLCDVFVDVGANVGLYTCLARAAGRRVVAIEPQAVNVQQIFRSLEANGWDDVEVWPVGVAAAPGALRLYGGGTGASLVRGWAGISDVFRQTIPVTTLDTLLAERFEGARLFVKMDIEGAELAALQGARALLIREPKPVWLIEITLTQNRSQPNPDFLRTFDLFFDAGYRASTADAAEQPVGREDVERWAGDPGNAPATYNWLFMAPS
jgi:FkbM family methyltransferase